MLEEYFLNIPVEISKIFLFITFELVAVNFIQNIDTLNQFTSIYISIKR